jgi:C4-dicarboxylate transporter DctQ subunit
MGAVLDGFVSGVDAVSEFTGRLAGWMFCAIGFFVFYEVVMRYAFTMPTIWVDEISRILQVWATYLAIAYVLKYRQHILIDVAFRDTATPRRFWVEIFSISVVVFFGLIAAKYGFDIWLKSTQSGHTTDSYLAVPKVFVDSSIWVGFGLLSLQGLSEIIKVLRDPNLIKNATLGQH